MSWFRSATSNEIVATARSGANSIVWCELFAVPPILVRQLLAIDFAFAFHSHLFKAFDEKFENELRPV